jgi:chorismate mutase
MNQTTESLEDLRKQIDEIDNQLFEIIAKRMRISKEIGTYKKEHNMTVLQTARYEDIINKRVAIGERLNMSANFTKAIVEAIHEESVRIQMDIMNNHD